MKRLLILFSLFTLLSVHGYADGPRGPGRPDRMPPPDERTVSDIGTDHVGAGLIQAMM